MKEGLGLGQGLGKMLPSQVCTRFWEWGLWVLGEAAAHPAAPVAARAGARQAVPGLCRVAVGEAVAHLGAPLAAPAGVRQAVPGLHQAAVAQAVARPATPTREAGCAGWPWEKRILVRLLPPLGQGRHVS